MLRFSVCYGTLLSRQKVVFYERKILNLQRVSNKLLAKLRQ